MVANPLVMIKIKNNFLGNLTILTLNIITHYIIIKKNIVFLLQKYCFIKTIF